MIFEQDQGTKPIWELFPNIRESPADPVDFDRVSLNWTPGISVFKRRPKNSSGVHRPLC